MSASFQLTLQNEEGSRHAADIQSLLFYNDTVYSGAEDGKIKIWNAKDLSYIGEIQAHRNCVYSLAAIENNLYSAANDNTVKCWDINSRTLKKIVHSGDASVIKLFVDGKRLYAGDETGFVGIYENNMLVNHLHVVEEVKDIVATGKYVFTVRNLDVTVTELLKAGDGKFAIRTQIQGAAPLALVGNHLCACTRDGKSISIYKISDTGGLQLLCTITVSEMIIIVLAARQQGNQSIIYSGGWDKVFRRWIITSEGQPLPGGHIIVPTIIYAFCIGSEGQAYVGGESGLICRLDLI